MPSLDSCIASVFEPGNPGNATDSGAITTPHYSGFLLMEDTTNFDDLDHLDDATPWLFIPAGTTAASWYLIVTGTWSGTIYQDYGVEDATSTADGGIADIAYSYTDPTYVIHTNGTYTPGQTVGPFWIRWRMAIYGSGAATLQAALPWPRHILIEEAGVVVGRLKLE
jgi:hypothetical protein